MQSESKALNPKGFFDTTKIKEGDVFQISPDVNNEMFAACFVTVSEVKSFGIQGYVQIPGEDGGQAYVRIKWEDLAYIGKACWVIE